VANVSEIRVVAFGELESRTWGACCLVEPGRATRVALGGASATEVADGVLEAGDPDRAWSLRGERLSLEFSPSGVAIGTGLAGQLETHDQLCSVTGQLQINGASAELDTRGWRTSVRAEVELGKLESFRWLAGWLAGERGFSLIALRPRRARGHEDDKIAATFIADQPASRIDDPRLSTTYTAEGLPARVGLELWLEAEDTAGGVRDGLADGERGAPPPDQRDAPPQYPRRASGVVVSRGPTWDEGNFRLHASLLRWRSHGRVGPGVYLLGRRR
jgi:hypothetical protein